MRQLASSLAIGIVLASATGAPAADLGTAFSYQGVLKQNGTPLNGTDAADLRFTLYEDAPLTSLIAGPVIVSGVDFTDGLFMIASIDFGAAAFDGQARWLLVEVSAPPGSAFVPLNPAQAILPAPYALALPGMYSQQTGSAPNLIGGYEGNTMTTGIIGGTIAGGGNAGTTNRVTDNFSTVGGGENNQAGNANGNVTDRRHATVAGGSANTASGLRSFVGGGEVNTASGGNTTVAGGANNIASIGYATVPGGRFNTAGGEYSFAAGRRSKVRTAAQVGGGDGDGDEGTFVWADSTDADFFSTGANQFLVRAAGGMGVSINGSPVDPDAGEAFSANGVVESTSGGFRFPDGTTQTTAASGGAGFWSPSGPDIFNSNVGNVGVGTTNPQAGLHVAGNSNVLALEGSDHAFLEYYPDTFAGGRKAWMGFGGPTSNDFELRNQIDGAHILLNTTGAGNVGIQMSVPTHRLSVGGDVFAQGPDGYDDAGDRAHLYLGDSNASVAAEAGLGLTFSAFQAQDAFTLQQVTGNVGIGNAAPTQKLDVAGDGKFTGGDVSLWSGTKAVTIRQDGSDSIISNKAGFNGNGAASNGLLLLNGEGGIRLRYGAAGSSGTDALTVDTNGNVGIGTTDPTARLHVAGNSNVLALEGSDHAFIEYYPDTFAAGRKAWMGFGGAADPDFSIRHESSASDINLITAEFGAVAVLSEGNPSFLIGELNGPRMIAMGQDPLTGGSYATFYDSGGPLFGNATIQLDGEAGLVRTKILEITGADVAEKFPVSDRPEPGMVVEIDPENPGKLRVSGEAYNRRVAGVVSGAGGLSAGAILGNLPGNESAPPIALSGRVWVQCDASDAAICPGDLLTTSSLPGHAMSVTDHPRAQGAIIGKAMTPLARGQSGLVLTLINLQ